MCTLYRGPRWNAANASRYLGDGYFRPTSGSIASMIYEFWKELERIEMARVILKPHSWRIRISQLQLAVIDIFFILPFDRILLFYFDSREEKKR